MNVIELALVRRQWFAAKAAARVHAMKIRLLLFLPLVLACEPPHAEPAVQLTRRQKDSVVARSGLPGARGVGRALDVLQASEDRAAVLDSIR